MNIIKSAILKNALFCLLFFLSVNSIAENLISAKVNSLSSREQLVLSFDKKTDFTIHVDDSKSIETVLLKFKDNLSSNVNWGKVSSSSPYILGVSEKKGDFFEIRIKTTPLSRMTYYSTENKQYNFVINLFGKDNSKSQNSSNENISSKSQSNRDIIIMIDPGHGGHDSGATRKFNGKQIYEKDLVLSIAKILKEEISREYGFEAYLTRSSDKFLGLYDRTNITRDKTADFFVSIHINAFNNSKVKGPMVFALSQRGATSTMGKWIADKENKTELIKGDGSVVDLKDTSQDVRKIFIDLSTNAIIDSSLKAGQYVLSNMNKVHKAHSDKVEQAGFAVLKSLDVPSLLVEIGFMSNNEEMRLMLQKSYQTKMANQIKKGLVSYFHDYPIINTKIYAKSR